MIKRHLLQPMIPGTIHPLHHQLSLHPRLDPYLLNPFHHALQLPMMDSSSFEKRINNSSERQSSSNYNNNNNRTPGSRPLRSFLIEDILKHSPKRSQVPSSAAATAETVVSGATSLSCDSPPLPASIRKNHRASSDRDSQDSTSNTANQASIKNPKKEPESASSTPSPKSSSTTSSEYYNHNLAATPRETTHKLPSLPDTKGKDPNLLCNPLSSIDGKDVVWPAWVYCTRYSDRPSSGEYTSIHSIHTTDSYHTIIHHLIHHFVKFVFLCSFFSSHLPFHLFSTWDCVERAR